ncbi:DUF4142 domain-containing protein [Noviherbaspirillum aridicola]|uniref:DUF4142 domain-containing protein n=1 Tax=Noviherbaspirillum aridicola TaxID=2849687 RepID=A0ABQ4PZE0_9BURK|nr:DUF4142 domain-containing protein [Noviherbaspirillum aridicola]GIZ50253.1 hypothetical protein NCCP691_02670 [Noviherbaspirillum aridicola]
MANISRRTARACALAVCLAALSQPALAQSSAPSAEGSGEGNRFGAARGSAATAPMQGGSAASGGRSNALGDPRSAPVPAGREGGAAFSHQPDRQEKPRVSNADAQLMRDLGAAHLAEIKMAALATAISGDEAIRLYAQKMLEEHYAALDNLRRVARTAGVVLPGGVATEHAALLRKQALLTGQEFDRAYLQEAGLALHEQSHKLAQSAMKASSPEVRNHAAMLLPVVEEHARLAETMNAEPAKAAAAVRGTLKAGQSVFLAQGAPAPGLARGGTNSGDKGNASVAGRPAGEVSR